MEGYSDSNLFSGESYCSVIDTKKEDKAGPRGSDRDRNGDRNSRDSRDNRRTQSERRERDRDGRNKGPGKDQIGLFCGNYNAGVPCDSSRCTRLN